MRLKKYFDLKINLDLSYKFLYRFNYILFIGSDGTGKSTVIKNLQDSLRLKSISYNLGQSNIGWAINLNKRLFNNYFLKKIKIANFFLLIDIILRRIKMLRHSNNKLILIDRFPGFIFLNTNFINNLIRLLLPKPNLVILLIASYKTRKKRKPSEIKNDQSKWYAVAKYLNCETLKLSTDKSKLLTTTNKIKKKIFSNKIYINNLIN